MANYLTHHRKKKIRLSNLEIDLEQAVLEGVPQEKLDRLAEKVRYAHVQVVRSELAQIHPNGKHADRERVLRDRIERWEAMPLGDIIESAREAAGPRKP